MPQSDKFGRHEVLHMAGFLSNCVDEQLLQHDQIKQNAEWRELADRASTALADLYQSIGAVHLGEGQDK